MADRIVASRYAQALLNVAGDGESLDLICAEVQTIAGMISDNVQFKAFLEGPSIVEEKKHSLMDKTFKDKVDQKTLDFIHLLLNKHRIDCFVQIAEEFQCLVEARRNQLRVQITTAFVMPEDMVDRLKRALDASIGLDCILEQRVDENIIGGVVAILGDRVIDGSLRNSLNEMRKRLMAAPL